MTPEIAESHAKLMQAWANGFKIQSRLKLDSTDDNAWVTNDHPNFNFVEYDWRIEPRPQSPEELYVCISYGNGVTNYAVLLHEAAAATYPCQEILHVKVVDRKPGGEQV